MCGTWIYTELTHSCPKRRASDLRPLTIRSRAVTIADPHPGAPVTMCTSHCSNDIIEAVVSAQSGACPERAMGGWSRRLRIALKGVDPRNDRPFIRSEERRVGKECVSTC